MRMGQGSEGMVTLYYQGAILSWSNIWISSHHSGSLYDVKT